MRKKGAPAVIILFQCLMMAAVVGFTLSVLIVHSNCFYGVDLQQSTYQWKPHKIKERLSARIRAIEFQLLQLRGSTTINVSIGGLNASLDEEDSKNRAVDLDNYSSYGTIRRSARQNANDGTRSAN
jgi:hypothetical protein